MGSRVDICFQLTLIDCQFNSQALAAAQGRPLERFTFEAAIVDTEHMALRRPLFKKSRRPMSFLVHRT